MRSLIPQMSMDQSYWTVGVLLVISIAQPASALNDTVESLIPLPENITAFGTTIDTDPINCQSAIWVPILRFFIVNYIGHAFTVKVPAGYNTVYALLFAVESLFLPYFGLLLACRTIQHFAVGEQDPLKRAARGGALCVVARTKHWKPRAGDKAYCWRSSPSTQGAKEKLIDRGSQVTAKRIWDGGLELEYLSQDFVQIHGLCHLPEGYMLARLPPAFEVKWKKFDDTNKEYEVNVSSSYSVMRTIIALVQLGSAIPTIWAVSKPENRKHGYAAYQLTVIPYALMSVVNTLATFTTPNYPASYLIRSSIMDEAKLRGGRFEGVIGELCESDTRDSLKGVVSGHGDIVGAMATFKNRTLADPDSAGNDIYAQFEDDDESIELIQWHPEKKARNCAHGALKALKFIWMHLVVETFREESPVTRWPSRWHQTRKARKAQQSLMQASQESVLQPDNGEPQTSDPEAGKQVARTPPVRRIRLNPIEANIIRLFKLYSFSERSKTPNMEPIVLLPSIGNPKPRKTGITEGSLFYISDLLFAISFAAPYLTTWGLTRYDAGDSTGLERTFYTLWLVMMQLACIFQHITWSFIVGRIAQLGYSNLIWGLFCILIIGGIWCLPAVAGFVLVALRMRGDDGTVCPDYGQYNSPT